MNPKLGIVILHFTNLPQARRFYTEAVGLSVLDNFSDDHFVTLQSGGDSQVGLSSQAGSAPAGSTEIGFEVNDVDKVYATRQAKGVTLLSEPKDFPFGRAFDAQDPEGHRLNIYKLRSAN